MDLTDSRTLPSPSTSSSSPYDSFDNPAWGSIREVQQLSVDNELRGNTPDPLLQWYTGNDGPWIPKAKPDHSEERRRSRAWTRYSTDPPSDSGYRTRRSIGNASVFSATIIETETVDTLTPAIGDELKPEVTHSNNSEFGTATSERQESFDEGEHLSTDFPKNGGLMKSHPVLKISNVDFYNGLELKGISDDLDKPKSYEKFRTYSM
jgi:hypothetical protein